MKSLFVIIMLVLPIFSFGQNLVDNGQFDFRSCPDSVINGTASAEWYYNSFHELTLNWRAYRGTPDVGGVATACNYAADFGYQYSLDSTGFYGFGGFIQNDWNPGGSLEILGCELLQPLTVGQTYRISFKASLAEISNYACNNLGVLFLQRGYQSSNGFATDMPYPNRAHFYSSQIISDTANWVEISGTFTADSAYTHMAIGRLEDDGFDTLSIAQQWPSGYAYYFVDDVCVVPEGGDCSEMVAIEEPIAVPQHLAIVPNPTQDMVRIDVGILSFEVIQYSIYNAQGQRMAMVEVAAGQDRVSIDVRNWSRGIYYILDSMGRAGRFVKE